jgi:1,4-alpha-glucan branching enzyme
LDIVFNQSDGLHPWYQMYPVGSNPFYNATAPHDYSVLNDFRQDYPLVEEHWGDVIRYWMQAYKVDGFRFDLVKGLGDNDSYGSGTEAYNSSRVNRMKRLNDIIKSVNPNGIHINELLGQNSEENANANNGEMGWNNVNYGSCQYAMGFAASSEDTKGFYSPNWSKTLGGTVDYAESHDEERMAGKIKQYGHASVKYSTSSPKKAAIQRLGSVAAQMLMSPGAKMIWEFGEIAADDAMGSDTEKLRAIAPKWDQMTDEGRSALHDNYQALCWLRKDNPELFNGSATYSYSGFAGSLTSNRYIRLINGDKEVIAVFNPNVTGSSVNISVPVQKISASNNQLITAAYGFEPSLSVNGSTATISVPAHSFAVYASTAVAGVEDINADFAKSVNVYGSNGRIVIDGDYNTVEIFDLQGRVSNSLDVPAGVYVVRVDGETFKVVVR